MLVQSVTFRFRNFSVSKPFHFLASQDALEVMLVSESLTLRTELTQVSEDSFEDFIDVTLAIGDTHGGGDGGDGYGG